MAIGKRLRDVEALRSAALLCRAMRDRGRSDLVGQADQLLRWITQRTSAEQLAESILDRAPETGRALRRARKRAQRSLGAVIARDGGACAYCKTALIAGQIHVDHVVPVSRGGSHEIGNLVASCSGCNQRKGARTPEEWKH